LYDNYFIDAPTHTPQFVRENLIPVDWSKADLKKESQWDKKTRELRKDSIQYVFSQIIFVQLLGVQFIYGRFDIIKS